MGNWTNAVVHLNIDGQPVTLKRSTDGRHALIARGHLSDISDDDEPENDHVHVWDLGTGDFRLHDMRLTQAMLPHVRDDEKNRPSPAQDAAFQTLLLEARQLASSTVTREVVDRAKALDREWRSAGRSSPRQHHDFRALIDQVFAANRDRIEQQRRDWASNKAAKERVVSQAETAATGADLRAGDDRMKSLLDEWKRIGPCEKADNERLWSRFQAARDRLRQRKEQEFNQRKAAWASNKAAKERLVAQMSSLVHSSDMRSAKDQARTLTDQWKSTGPCDRADNDRLWNDFKAAKDRLFEAAKRQGDQRRAEARQRAQERVYRLEEQLRNVEASIYRAEESYSRALSARSPSTRNPNFYSILSSQQQRQSSAREKIVSLSQRKSDIISKLLEARSRLNQF